MFYAFSLIEITKKKKKRHIYAPIIEKKKSIDTIIKLYAYTLEIAFSET